MSESTSVVSSSPAPASRPAPSFTPAAAPPVAAPTSAGPSGGNGVAARARRAGEAGPARVAADHARSAAHLADTATRVAGLLGGPELAPFGADLQGIGYRSPGRATRAAKAILVRGEVASEVQHALVRFVGLEYVLYLLDSLDRERVAHADLLGETARDPGAGERSSVKNLAYRAAGFVARGLEYAYQRSAEKLGGAGPVPPYAIWDGIEEEIGALERAVDSRAPGAEAAPDLGDVTARVRKILALLLPRQQQIGDYLAATVIGGQRVVTTLQVAEGLADLGLLLVSGGLASGLKAGAKVGIRKVLAEGAKYTAKNLGKGALLAGATTGATRLVKGTAREVGLYWAGLQDDIHLTRVIVDAGVDAAVAVVGALAGGYLSKGFLRAFAYSLSRHLNPLQLALLRAQADATGMELSEVFVGRGWAFVAGLFGGALTAVLTAAVTTAIGAIRGNEQRPQGVRPFIDLVVQYLWQGALAQTILAAIVHAPTSRPSPSAMGGRGPVRPLRPPGKVAAPLVPEKQSSAVPSRPGRTESGRAADQQPRSGGALATPAPGSRETPPTSPSPSRTDQELAGVRQDQAESKASLAAAEPFLARLAAQRAQGRRQGPAQTEQRSAQPRPSGTTQAHSETQVELHRRLSAELSAALNAAAREPTTEKQLAVYRPAEQRISAEGADKGQGTVFLIRPYPKVRVVSRKSPTDLKEEFAYVSAGNGPARVFYKGAALSYRGSTGAKTIT